MSCEEWFERLNDYVDGELAGTQRAAVDRHIQSCAGCRLAVDELRGLLAAAAALPESIAPERDLWEGASAALRQSGATTRAGRRASGIASAWWSRPAAALAAAAVLIVCSAAVTTLLVRDRAERRVARPAEPAGAAGTAGDAGPAETSGASAAGAGILPEMAAVEAEYEDATRLLLQALRQRDNLPAGALDAIEKNLRVIDRAIADSRAALRRDPYNARLGQMVTEACQRKLDLLRDVARLTARA